jgi:hypothetical protein
MIKGKERLVMVLKGICRSILLTSRFIYRAFTFRRDLKFAVCWRIFMSLGNAISKGNPMALLKFRTLEIFLS